MKGIPKDKTSAVCVSLGLHLLAAAVLIPGVWGEGLSHAFTRERISFFWVSLGEAAPEKAMAVRKPSFGGRSLTEKSPAPAVMNSALSDREKMTAEKAVAQAFSAPALPESVSESKAGTLLTQEAHESTQGISGATWQTAAAPDRGLSAGDVSGVAGGLNGTQPMYADNRPPAYPEIARVRGYQGVVLVVAEVLPDGTVGRTKIKKSSGYAILDGAAISAVKPWKFRPAVKEGRPFAVWVELPIRFQLQDSSSG